MECVPIGNVSGLAPPVNFTEAQKRVLKDISNVFYNYGLPVVCLFGIVGNILNLTILTRRKLQKSYRTVEQAAYVCLIGLALSDLMFCVFAFPTTFLPTGEYYKTKGFILYYGMYSTAVINVFIMSSTWLTVTMATERYIAICHPLNSKLFMTLSKTKLIIVLVYLVSVAFNIPVLWRYQIHEVLCENRTSKVYHLKQVPLCDSNTLDHGYRVLWAIVGNFIPLILLIGFNICICYKIHKSYKLRQKFHCEQDPKDPNNTLTITLIVIIVMFFILVAPSEIVLHIAQITKSDSDATYKAIEVVMNFMQSVNFSVNFVLYCIISPYFRKTLRHILCCDWYNNRRDSYKFNMTDCSKQPLKGP
ncbi:FMRFamide receptor-like [Mizuhopecten yessoensis]|uniref:FMRFamide receptor-like n=1 Tax=Mizuhopecten yessoensis TaxID=6573 RepID=UPI000B459D59|nr:FMRFamide receptor-like [Mizuhopecten yessoensis]